jgi:hypothetical protein
MERQTTKPNIKELRKFGLTTGIIVALLFGMFLPWIFSRPSPRWPWGVSSVLIIWALITPGTLKIVYSIWMRISHVLGYINTKIVLAIVFYLVFTPMGVLMKIFRKDPMRRKIDNGVISYRCASVKQPKEHMERPY